MAPPSNDTASKADALLRLLEGDPNNLPLLADAADAALAERRPELTRQLLDRYAQIEQLPPHLQNQTGLAAMALGDFDAAKQAFSPLQQQNPDDAALRFNLAWSCAMLREFESALDLLDETTVEALPQAAALQVQLLHDSERHDEAFDLAKRYIAVYPTHRGLAAATSVLAMDMEDVELARECATRGGDHPDALTTLGVLALGDERQADAESFFDRAIARQQKTPRAWVGKGLAALSSGNSAAAAEDIERGAQMFGDHVGSWIAAGWAHLLKGDREAARRCFDLALSLDHNFSESHGSLAVVAAMEGHWDDARRLAATAIRLDRASFSGALANALVLRSRGKPEAARQIIERALNTPIDANGKTIAQVLARQALRPQ